MNACFPLRSAIHAQTIPLCLPPPLHLDLLDKELPPSPLFQGINIHITIHALFIQDLILFSPI